jgi:integrase
MMLLPFSTKMFNEKVNFRIVQDLMGHTSQAMSLYYSRSSENDRLNAIDNRVSSIEHSINIKTVLS